MSGPGRRGNAVRRTTVLHAVKPAQWPTTVEEPVMSARKTPMLALAAVALGLALTACGNGGDGGSSDDAAPATPAATATANSNETAASTAPSAPAADATGGTSSDTPQSTRPDQGTGEKCTDQVNYAGDPRSNAEINSIGEETGTCPPVQSGGTQSGTPKEDGVKCTDQVNYAGDPRSNAEINSIGEETGTCPPVQDK
ncbi:hypothetical protein GCM10023257_67240 [Streptomyces hyderabadensis]|uniref:Secreted protein n=2 Tax=Streptomyces TaxID=1883 RepID=A0ABP9IUH3_9ACTN